MTRPAAEPTPIPASDPPKEVRVAVTIHNPRVGPVLAREVAEVHWARVAEQLKAAAPAYGDTWRFVSATFPNICLHVLDLEGTPRVGMLLNARNYNHRALAVTLTTPDFRLFLVPPVPRRAGETGRCAMAFNPKEQRIWFCVPGTDEFHTQYRERYPFEYLRATPVADPVEVVMRCIENIDRTALAPPKKEKTV